MKKKITSFITNHARNFGHFRFEEPIVVFESDDWGKVAGKVDGIYPLEFGTRTDWSHDKLESEAELDALYRLLKSYKNDFERPPVFTANFIVSNPDFEATKALNYEKLILKNIDIAFPNLLPKWKSGMENQVFYPQYHGSLHHNYKRFLDALQTDEKTRFLFNQGINGGLENFDETKYALYSEYQNCQTEEEIQELKNWTEAGLDTFQSIFGYRSASAISPNYVSPPAALAAFAKTDVKYIQAGNKVLWLKNGTEQRLNYCQGTQLKSGLVALARNHKFEPCRGKSVWKAAFSAKSAITWINRGVPAVLDTHRMNYVGKFADNSLGELKILLDTLRVNPKIRFLTSPELGEALTNNGAYTDVFSGEKKKLTPRDSWFRKLARSKIS